MLNEDNTINIKIHRDESNILRAEVPSRHVKSRVHRCYVNYEPESIGCSGIKRHYCKCANGTRTVGCCSHVATVVYYLSYARYLSRIIRPPEIRSSTMAPAFPSSTKTVTRIDFVMTMYILLKTMFVNKP
jgi:hypothetical protein